MVRGVILFSMTCAVALALSFAVPLVVHSQGVGPVVNAWSEVVEQPVTVGVKAGAHVAASGSGFGAQPGTVEVAGCLTAVVTSWAADRVAFVVPPVPPSGNQPIMVTIFTSDGRYYRSAGFRIIP